MFNDWWPSLLVLKKNMQIRHKKLLDNLIADIWVEHTFTHLQILLSLMSKFGKWLGIVLQRWMLAHESDWAIWLYRLLWSYRLTSVQCRDMIRYVRWIADSWVTRITTIENTALPELNNTKLYLSWDPQLFVAQQTKVYKRSLQNDIVKLWR